MIVEVTEREGGIWIPVDTEVLQFMIWCGFQVHAIKCGDWIYDRDLKRHGYNPIRRNDYTGQPVEGD